MAGDASNIAKAMDDSNFFIIEIDGVFRKYIYQLKNASRYGLLHRDAFKVCFTYKTDVGLSLSELYSILGITGFERAVGHTEYIDFKFHGIGYDSGVVMSVHISVNRQGIISESLYLF